MNPRFFWGVVVGVAGTWAWNKYMRPMRNATK